MVKNILNKNYPWSYSVILYIIAMLGDWGSSFIGNYVPGIYESNPLTRDANYHFVFYKAIPLELAFVAFLFLFTWSANWVLKYYNLPKLGMWLTSGLVGYIGLNRLIEAVIPNIYLIISQYK